MFVSISLACFLSFSIRTPQSYSLKSSHQAHDLPKLLIQISCSAQLQTSVSQTHHVHLVPNNLPSAAFDLYYELL